MSFNTPFLLLLLLLCISFHACNARRLAVYTSRVADNLHIANPNEEKRVSVGAAKVESRTTMSHKSSKTTSEDTSVLKNKEEKVILAEKNGRKEPAVSVQWRVPHNNNKHEEKHPGFNLDYAPPKTHPPSHN